MDRYSSIGYGTSLSCSASELTLEPCQQPHGGKYHRQKNTASSAVDFQDVHCMLQQAGDNRGELDVDWF
ncbi:unnamed protein product [Dibothriocephalus latus]|uniref:Uncharacterized protein n=1 Tax=Dibothriocephalus latus TaxID=60516 RepID=A0A3P7R295_DIBLA|nr:unnamed protein product [Dibothriocephalus latus]